MGTTKSPRLDSRQVGLKHGFRSGLEEDTAAGLLLLGVDFSYEQMKIEYEKPSRVSKYTPDFVVTTRPDGTPKPTPLIIETKGRFLLLDRQKHLLVKRQHPHLDIRFVFNNPRAKISKTSKSTYGSWCEKHGFLYAKNSIPHNWLTE